MAICGVVASESLLTYEPVRSGGIPRSALHLTIPEQAPTPEYSDRRLGQSRTERLPGEPQRFSDPDGHRLRRLLRAGDGRDVRADLERVARRLAGELIEERGLSDPLILAAGCDDRVAHLPVRPDGDRQFDRAVLPRLIDEHDKPDLPARLIEGRIKRGRPILRFHPFPDPLLHPP